MPREENKWFNKNDLKSMSTGSRYSTFAVIWCTLFSKSFDNCSTFQDLAVDIPTALNLYHNDDRAAAYNQVGKLVTELLALGIKYGFKTSQLTSIFSSALIISATIEIASLFMVEIENPAQHPGRPARA